MIAYIIVDVMVTNPERYDDYKKLTPASLIPYDGKFIVRVVPPKLWKETGPQAALLFCNFLQ